MQRIRSANKLSKFKNTSNCSRSREDWNSDRKIEVFEFTGTFAAEVQVPLRLLGNLKSCVRISRRIDSTHDKIFLTTLNTKIMEPCFPPQSSSCKVNISPVRFHAAPKPKLVLIGFSQRTWKIIPAKSKTQKGWIHRHVQALHEYFTARRLTWSWWSSTLFLTLMEDAEQTQTWKQKNRIDALIARTNTERLSTFGAVQGHSHGVTSNPTFLWERYYGQPNGESILEEWSMGRRIESEKHETSLCLLISASATSST